MPFLPPNQQRQSTEGTTYFLQPTNIMPVRFIARGLGQILHDQLHRLDVPDRVLFKLAATVHQCLVRTAAHHRICRSTASRSPVLTRAGISPKPPGSQQQTCGPVLGQTERERVYLPTTITKILHISCYNGRLPVEALAHRSWPPMTDGHTPYRYRNPAPQTMRV